MGEFTNLHNLLDNEVWSAELHEIVFLLSTTMLLNGLIHLLDSWMRSEGPYELGYVFHLKIFLNLNL